MEDYVISMLEDSTGAIWFGTGGSGLSRYDGVTWRSFTRSDGLPGDDINGSTVLCLLEGPSGGLWVGTWANGVGHYDGSGWRTFTTADGLADNNVASILKDQRGNIWFCTLGEGVSRFDGATWRTFTKADGLVSDTLSTSYMDRAGNLWFGTFGGGVNRFDGTSWATYTTSGGYVTAIHEDQAGNLWFGTYGSGVSRYDGATWRTYTTADGLAHDEVTGIVEDRWGRLWFGTSAGVTRYDGTIWRTYTEADGLANDRVSSMLRDSSGNLWFGTTGGVSRFDGSSWKSFTMGDGLVGEQAWAVLEDRAGDLWVGTGRGVSRFDGSTWRSYTTADGLVDQFVGYLFEDRSRNIWAATGSTLLGNGGGVSRYDGSSWTAFTSLDGFSARYVISMLEDRSGNYWFLTDRGLIRYDGSTWRTFTTADGLAHNSVSCMLEDRSGNLWFGTSSGVSRYDGVAWRSFAMADGVGDSVVSTMHEDRSGNIWLGSRFGRVSRYDGSRFQSFQLDESVVTRAQLFLEDSSNSLWVSFQFGGLHRFDGSTWWKFTTEVTSMLQDRTGDLWIGTRTGLRRFDGTIWRSLTQSDGLVGNDVHCMLEDRSGDLWFGAIDLDRGGVSRYEPDRISPQTVYLSTPPGLSASREHGAAFVAAFGETRRIEYSYRLNGGPWTDWALAGGAFLTGLAQGVHVLEARSRDALANTDSTPARAVFEIDAEPPAPLIFAPAFGGTASGTTNIVGKATDSRFASYRVEVRPSGSTTWEGATLLGHSVTLVENGPLASWDTTSLPDGLYDLRLVVADALGLTGTAQVTVLVDNHFPFADQTAPTIVSAAVGGDLYTNDAEVHLYFPPKAFRDDALVSISEMGAASDTLASGAVRASPPYLVSWSAPLSKPATLSFATGSAHPWPLAIYHSPDGAEWTRLGGTAEEGQRSLAITFPGEYALFTDTAPVPEGAVTLSPLSFTPRVFSPSGSFANDHVAIGFTLGQSTAVTARVYNRAGRLVREVVSGDRMGPGSALVRWDGRDRAGVTVTDGLYLVTVEAMGQTQRKTIAVVR